MLPVVAVAECPARYATLLGPVVLPSPGQRANPGPIEALSSLLLRQSTRMAQRNGRPGGPEALNRPGEWPVLGMSFFARNHEAPLPLEERLPRLRSGIPCPATDLGLRHNPGRASPWLSGSVPAAPWHTSSAKCSAVGRSSAPVSAGKHDWAAIACRWYVLRFPRRY